MTLWLKHMTVRTGLELSMRSDPTYMAENENNKKKLIFNYCWLMKSLLFVLLISHDLWIGAGLQKKKKKKAKNADANPNRA